MANARGNLLCTPTAKGQRHKLVPGSIPSVVSFRAASAVHHSTRYRYFVGIGETAFFCKRKSSPRWFELSAEVLLPAIEEKKRATKKFYQIGDASSKIKLTKMRRQVADLVEAAKIRWIEKKVEEMENKFDPRGA